MKIIYYINKFILISTVILYITVFLGLYAQIVLGAVQVISALLLFMYWQNFNQKTKKQIYTYWSIITIYGIFWLFDWNNTYETIIFIIGLIIIPMGIASYFFYILYLIKKSSDNEL